jgi:hypothetical protein
MESLKLDPRQATQIFYLRTLLINYCGSNLTGDLIEEILDRFIREIIATRDGCSWAFRKEL